MKKRKTVKKVRFDVHLEQAVANEAVLDVDGGGSVEPPINNLTVEELIYRSPEPIAKKKLKPPKSPGKSLRRDRRDLDMETAYSFL